MPLLTNKVVWQSHFVAPDAPVAPDAASRVNQFMQTRDPLTLGHIFMPNPPVSLTVALTLRIRRISR